MQGRRRIRACILQQLQADLESIYRVEAGLSVTDFLLDRAQRSERSQSSAPEELLVREEDGDVELGLYIADEVLDELSGNGDWTHRRLQAHCRAVEGVSHFLYVTQRAVIPRPVSQLELELQAEIDKFVTVVLSLWESGRRHAASFLRQLLFEEVSFRSDLSDEARARYVRANWLASRYCRFLERQYITRNSIEGFLADLRRIYRMGAGEKLSHAAR